MIRSLGLSLATLALAVPAAAQDASSQKDDIIVRGQRDKEVETFVRSLTETRDGRQVARWNGRICPKVVGLWPERAAMITDRIAAVAKLIDVSMQVPPKCEPNTIIAFTGQADLFTAKMIDSVPTLITDVEYYGLPRRKQVARYLAPRAVRWFSINATTMSDGQHAGAAGRNGAGLAIDASPNSTPASRITARTRENTIATLIVIDESKLGGIKWLQLADYLAMVTFAQPAIDADFTGSDSVMAIFAARDAGGAGPAGLTAQDRGFLTGLYRSAANLSSSQQRGVIADAVRKTPKAP
ncbi:hypothetical protein [Sphingomonas bacterium]|uniref:hypothetical protein n=1 Tax=Sphingomonas bacterium TaxID=1895847 RepID=UPI0026097770|nr:hypothetical protein [Sphingomonas bacterium]MDB5679548.1 hypothetical protein [Sphingomonas bacterium]